MCVDVGGWIDEDDICRFVGVCGLVSCWVFFRGGGGGSFLRFFLNIW